MTAEQLLLDRRFAGRVQFYREQDGDDLYLVFYKSRGGHERTHQQRFLLQGNTLIPVDG